MQGLFLSTLSLRRATLELFLYYQDNTISIHALLAESDRHIFQVFAAAVIISIHALLAESDRPPLKPAMIRSYFYPRSPCGERLAPCQLWHGVFLFLSTLSLRRATICKMINSAQKLFLSTLSLRRATRSAITIKNPIVFLSTLSLRRATLIVVLLCHHMSNFYPRSPCGERPRRYTPAPPAQSNFYPRSPCGERL